jgi:hypothetical protein
MRLHFSSLVYVTKEIVVRFEVFTAVTVKNGVFWDVTPCGSCKNRRFAGTWRLLHQGDPDEGGARFLRNVGSYKSHTV